MRVLQNRRLGRYIKAAAPPKTSLERIAEILEPLNELLWVSLDEVSDCRMSVSFRSDRYSVRLTGFRRHTTAEPSPQFR